MSLSELCVAPETKPATPTFIIEEISQPYDVPPTTTTTVDPYTGEKTTITYPGYHVENKTTYIKIKNQPNTQPNNGTTLQLYYQQRYKGHYSNDEWILYPSTAWGYAEQSDSEYTLLLFSKGMPRHGQVDIQIRALTGTIIYEPAWLTEPERFVGVAGDWSDIVVVSFDPLSFTVLPFTSTPSTDETECLPSDSTGPLTSNPDQSTTSNPSPLQTPWASYLLTIIITTCIILIPIAIVMYYNKRQQKRSKHTKVA